ncbi:P-loop containing nucleoside triphosphate hydrolase protein, partial [Pholiota molesta]
MSPSSFSDSESETSQQIRLATPNNPSENAIGLSNPKLSQGRRRMLDLVNRLLSTGVQVDIDLPQIAVIGSQSSGKSSLIESISGIKFPRASGTCTRCPLECRLARSDAPWQCIVSLRFITDPDGR